MGLKGTFCFIAFQRRRTLIPAYVGFWFHCSPDPNTDLYQYLSPLGWEHINLTGEYVWRQSRKLEDGKFRPLRQVGKP